MQPCNGVRSSTFSIDRIAMVEADEGLAMIRSCGLPAMSKSKSVDEPADPSARERGVLSD
jgi:hypothetical protein